MVHSWSHGSSLNVACGPSGDLHERSDLTIATGSLHTVGKRWLRSNVRTPTWPTPHLPRELVLVALNTLPLLAVRRNPLVVAVFSVAYPTWVALGHPIHELQSCRRSRQCTRSGVGIGRRGCVPWDWSCRCGWSPAACCCGAVTCSS